MFSPGRNAHRQGELLENSVFALAQRHSVALGRGSGSEVFAYLDDATELREPVFA